MIDGPTVAVAEEVSTALRTNKMHITTCRAFGRSPSPGVSALLQQLDWESRMYRRYQRVFELALRENYRF